MKYITSIPFTNYATILFSLLINVVMTAIVYNDLNGVFQFYSGLPIGLVFAILLFFYLLVSKRVLFVQLIITALNTSLLFLWIRNVPIDNSIFDALTASLALVVTLAICIGIVCITSSSTNLFYNIMLIQTLLAALSYTLSFTLQFFYINYIIAFGCIYLYSAYKQQAYRQSGLVSPWILSTLLYIFTLAIFIINEVVAESIFSKFLQFYNFREKGELLSNICSNSYSIFQHLLLSAKSYLFPAWEIEGSAPHLNPSPDSLKFPNVSEMRRAGSNGIKGTYIARPSKATSAFCWTNSIPVSVGLKIVFSEELPAAKPENIQEDISIDAVPLDNDEPAPSKYESGGRATTSSAFYGGTPIISNSLCARSDSSLFTPSTPLPPALPATTITSSSWALNVDFRRLFSTIIYKDKFIFFTEKTIFTDASVSSLEDQIKNASSEDFVIGILKNNSSLADIIDQGDNEHNILIVRGSKFDLIYILTTSLRIAASQSTYNTKSLEEFRLTLENDQEEGVKTVTFSKIPIKQPFTSRPYLDRYGKPKSQYLAPLIIISEPEITDKLIAEDFKLKPELNAAIKHWNVDEMERVKRACLTTLERTKIVHSDVAYPPTADGDVYPNCISIKSKTK